MDRWLIALVAGLVGGAGGGLAVHLMTGTRTEVATADDDGVLREVRDRLRAIEARVDRPALAAGVASPTAGDPASGPGAGAASAATTAASASVPGRGDLETVAARAAELVLERQESRKKEAEKAAERKKVTLAEAARELELTSTQEEELRRAYAETTEKALKVMAEPETDAESLRRELDEAKDDPAKKSAITMRLLPKFFTKMGDVIALQAERTARVQKILGPEKASKFRRFDVVEEDPWGLGDSISIGASTGE